jgi:RecB family exonuclease
VLRVSPSEIAKFRRCRRSWALTYYYRWGVDPLTAPATSAALLGTRIHAALEAYYGYDINPCHALGVIYDYERSRRPDSETALTAEQDWAMIMVSGYLDWAAETGIDEEYDTVAVERAVEVPILMSSGEMAIVTGKLDQIVRRRMDGALCVRDWKTVATLHKADLLVLDEQMRIYAALLTAASNGMRVDGAIYAMLLRSKRTARSSGPYYEQVHIGYNGLEHRNMIDRLRGVLEDMDRVTKQLNAGTKHHREVAYPNPMTDRCKWDCPFTSVCHMFDDGSRVEDAMKANYMQLDPYHYRNNDLIDTVKAAFGVTSPVKGVNGAE